MQVQPNRGARQGAEQRPEAADHGHHDHLARRLEGKRFGRHIALHDAQQSAREARISRCDDEGEQLIGMHIVADRGRAQRVFTDCDPDATDRRGHDAARDDDAYDIAGCQKSIHRPASRRLYRGEAQVESRRRDPRQAIFAAGERRQRRVFHEEENFGDRHGDHGEIDAGAPQGNQPDEIAGDGRRDRSNQ